MSDKQLKIGILGTAYGCADTLYQTVAPWIHLKDLGYDLTLALSHGMFSDYKDFKEDNDVKTQELLKSGIWYDYLYLQNDYSKNEPRIYQTEAEIRDKSLQFLLSKDIDMVILVDFQDEFYTEKQIDDIIEFLENNPFECWYRLRFANFLNSNFHYYKGFNPPRVFRTKYKSLKLHKMEYDNDVSYIHTNGQIIHFSNLASITIPENVALIRHHSWNNYERSVEKINYHNIRWAPPNGNGCSFKVDEVNKQIVINQDYYNRIGQSPPEILELKNA